MAMQYDVPLDLISNNSLSLIARLIKPKTTVLEFGPAYGRLTRYLKEELGCDVYIVELDEDAALAAAKYAKRAFVGDIEQYKWADEFRAIKFDYAVFADVLEHLRDPKRLLEEVRGLLKYDASILLSVPNIAHNSVIINLLNNSFEYRDVGLLDKTHIRFFTINSLERMLEEAHFSVCQKYTTNCKTDETEFQTPYTSVNGVPPHVFKTREYGEVYQFIYEAKLAGEAVMERRNYISARLNHYNAQVFIDLGAGFSENTGIIKYLNPADKNISLRFELNNFGTNIQTIRLDPLNEKCVIEIKGITCVTDAGESLSLNIQGTNAVCVTDNTYYFTNSDPQVYIKPPRGVKELQIDLIYILFDSDVVDTMGELINGAHLERLRLLDAQAGKERELEELQTQRDEIIAEKDEIIAEKDEAITQKDKIIAKRQAEIHGIIAQKDDITTQYHAAVAQRDVTAKQYHAIANAVFWKATKPLRASNDSVKRFMKRTPGLKAIFKVIYYLRHTGVKGTWRKIITRFRNKEEHRETQTEFIDFGEFISGNFYYE